MKNLLKILLVCCISFCPASRVFASEGFSELYLLKKSDSDSVSGIIRAMLKSKGYKVYGSKKMYVVPENVDVRVPKYYILLFEQNKKDCYYYNFTSENYMLNDLVLEEFDKRKINYKTKNNKDLKELFEESAIAFKSRAENFNLNNQADKKQSPVNIKINQPADESSNSDTIQTAVNVFDDVKKISMRDLNGRVVTIPAGTVINLKLQSDINTVSLSKNDTVTAELRSDLIYDDVLIAPAGSILYGKPINIKRAGYKYGNSSVELSFNELMTPDGKSLNLCTETIKLKTNIKNPGKITRDIAFGSTIGLVGGIAAALMGIDMRNSVIWGLGEGAGSGTTQAILQRGENVEIQDYMNMYIKLVEPVIVAD